ncbi:MAG: hypothetical protein IAE89_04830 [Anaerolineae bacterium]|nr:hypothetical protein [Anaerolineae bacterium]
MKRSTIVTFSSLCLIIIASVMLVQVGMAASGDGRINEVDHLGGLAVYCVDAHMNPASAYNAGGIRVLDGNGDEVLFVTHETIVEVDIPETNTLLGEANAAYGTLALYRLTSGEFQINGVDEFSKLFEFIWRECTPVRAARSAPTAYSTAIPSTAIPPTAVPTTTALPV